MRALLILIAGLSGAIGVGLSAYAAHKGGANAETAARFLLVHAPAFLVIGLADQSRLLIFAGSLLAVGLILFAGDLLAREFLGGRLFPMAAPLGGLALMAGWFGIALGGATALVRPDRS